METPKAPPETAAESLSDATPPVALTPHAVDRIKALIASEGGAGHGLRVTVRDGGCSGFSYGLDLAAAPSADDLVFEQDGAAVFVERAAVSYLAGTTIDYVTGLHHAGFRFVNPRATRTCGCGESFAV